MMNDSSIEEKWKGYNKMSLIYITKDLSNFMNIDCFTTDKYGNKIRNDLPRVYRAFIIKYLGYYINLCNILDGVSRKSKILLLDNQLSKTSSDKYLIIPPRMRHLIPCDFNIDAIIPTDMSKIVDRHNKQLFIAGGPEFNYEKFEPVRLFFEELKNVVDYMRDKNLEALLPYMKRWIKLGLAPFTKPKKFEVRWFWRYSKQTQNEIFTFLLCAKSLPIHKDCVFLIIEKIASNDI